MMPRLHIVLLFFYFLTGNLFSQIKKADTVFCDCDKARAIKISGNQKTGPTISPQSSGELQEISAARQKSKFTFEKEHHSAWYKLVIATDGHLSFDIIPVKPDDDYDFMLFEAGKNNFCDSLVKNKIKPIRANISRDKTELGGKTGLSFKAKKELIKEGINDAFSLPVKVRKGDIYYLVLDNVYEKGGGHTILFYFAQKVDIKGVVKNDEDKPLITNVTITDISGTTIAETITNAKTGAYEINTILRKNSTYSINYFNDSSFVFSKNISIKDSVELKNIKVILPKLKRGKKYSIGTINFYGGSPEYLPSAAPTISNLFKLLQKNKNLKIRIVGHVNGCEMKRKGEIDAQLLSELRAVTIRDYLIKNEIEEIRIETLGMGCKEMLYPVPKSEKENELNRRVEIMVLEY